MTDSGRKIFNIVVAVLVSIAAWVFVVYNYYPNNQVRYTDVPVSFKGEDNLAERGLAVRKAGLETVSVTLSQKRVDGNKISADDISVTADVSECVAGDNKVDIIVRGPADTSVISYSSASTSVEVSRTKSETMDIDVVYDEGAGENEEPIASDLGYTSAEVSCASEMFGRIRKIAAVLSRDDVSEEEKSYTLTLQALDSNGNAIPHVVITPDEISLDAYAGYTKTVDLVVNVKDDSDDNYERKYSAPSVVTIKGSKDALSSVDSINSKEIDVSYYYENDNIEIEYELPEGVYIANSSLGQKLRLMVTQKEDEEE